jgi:hypothetical protein
MTQIVLKRRSLAARIRRAPRVVLMHYRICRRYGNRWDASCAGLRLTWATLSV